MLFCQREKSHRNFYLLSILYYLSEAFWSSNPCLRQGYILPFMRRQRKLSNGRERLVAGLEPYYVYEQKENRPTLSVEVRASGIRTHVGALVRSCR